MTTEISLVRLYALRSFYLVMAVGLGMFVWPDVIHHANEPLLAPTTAHSLLAGIGTLAVLGLRYPLRMLPLLIFEVTWKLIFLVFYALPLWRSGDVDAASLANIQAVLVVILFIPTIPWRYVMATYVIGTSERWT
jgi:hypothetical protein